MHPKHEPQTLPPPGNQLLELNEDELLLDLALSHSQVRVVQSLQRAATLFDRIATLPRCQRKVSEMEMRLYLAGQGASSGEISKVGV